MIGGSRKRRHHRSPIRASILPDWGASGNGRPYRDRREFTTLLGAVAAWPLAASAQQAGKTPRVGYIREGTPNNDQVREEFVRGMRDLGYVEERNITYEFRHYGDDVESIPSLICDHHCLALFSSHVTSGLLSFVK
jgi:hypothetical protein